MFVFDLKSDAEPNTIEIKFISGVATSFTPSESAVTVSSLAYDPASRKITIVLSQSMADLVLDDFRYSSVTVDVEVSRTRPSAVIMPRSMDQAYDLDPSYFLFYSWIDLEGTSWLPQAKLHDRVVSRVRITAATIADYRVRTGDYLFLEDDDFLYPIEITHVENNHLDFMVVSDGAYTTPSTSQDVKVGRRIYTTRPGQKATWIRCVKSIELDLDILALVTDTDYQTYETVVSSTILNMNDLTYGLVSAEEGSSPGTALIELSAYVPTSKLPANADFIVIDMKGEAGDEVGRRMTIGGSRIEMIVYDAVGTEVSKTRFN